MKIFVAGGTGPGRGHDDHIASGDVSGVAIHVWLWSDSWGCAGRVECEMHTAGESPGVTHERVS